MFYVRWAVTVVAFPIGGLLVSLILGNIITIPSAAIAGLIAGSVVGLAQWIAIRRFVGWQWIVGTAVGFALGAAASFAVFRGSISLVELSLTGLLTGAIVGAGQGMAFRRGWRVALLWVITTALSWSVGWVVSLMVITSNASNYIVFGSSGAAVVTVITALVLRRILGDAVVARTVEAATVVEVER